MGNIFEHFSLKVLVSVLWVIFPCHSVLIDMGVICFVCHSHFVGTNDLVRHMRLIHGLYPGKSLRLKCAQAGCCCVLSTFSGFRKHLNSKHAESIESDAETDNIVDSYDTVDDTRSQHFEGAASSSKVLPAPNISTRDVCICYSAASSCWCRPVHFKQFCIIHGRSYNGGTKSN